MPFFPNLSLLRPVPACVALMVATAVAPAMAAEAFTINDIRIEGLQRGDPGSVFGALPFRVGDTYNDDKGAAALRALFATGLFKDVRIDVDGKVVVVVVDERALVATVSFTGLKEFEKDTLLKALKDNGIGEGLPYDRAVLDRAEQEIKRQYLSKSFYGAEVVTTITPIERNRVNVAFNVVEGDVANKKLRVLWLDAHADFNTNILTPSGNIHGMPVACLCGHGPKELIEIGGQVPAINPKWIRQIGIRSVDEGEKRFVHQIGLEVFDMRYIDEMGMRAAMELALALVDANTHLHVSFDVDFLDPDIAPGVGTTVPGGPTYREAQLCMEMIADTGRLASLDVMELNPALDVRNRTAEVAVDLIESLFGKSTLMRK